MNNIIDEYVSPVDLSKVEELEIKIGIKFSAYYKDFLCKNNGGRPEKDVYDFTDVNGRDNSSDVTFFSVVKEECKYLLLKENEVYKDRIPKNFIAIGSDSGGSIVLMERLTGEIYFWDHEFDTEADPDDPDYVETDGPDMYNCYFLAKNFEEFFNEKLYEFILEDDEDDE